MSDKMMYKNIRIEILYTATPPIPPPHLPVMVAANTPQLTSIDRDNSIHRARASSDTINTREMTLSTTCRHRSTLTLSCLNETDSHEEDRVEEGMGGAYGWKDHIKSLLQPPSSTHLLK